LYANHLHFEQAGRLLRAGKHVLCEKPLALDSREIRDAGETGARNEDRWGGRLQFALLPAVPGSSRANRERDKSASLAWCTAAFYRIGCWHPTDWNWRLEPKLGGELRAVSDIGTHWLDLVTWITGRKVTEVCADLATVVPVRQKPRGRVETFQKAAGDYDEIPITTDDCASVAVAIRGRNARHDDRFASERGTQSALVV